MKKTIKNGNGNGKRKIFSKVNKRAYIALLLLVVLAAITVAVRNRAMNSLNEQATFDDEAWEAAVAESGVNYTETEEPQMTAETKEEMESVPVIAETIPKEEPKRDKAEEYIEVVEAAAMEELVFVRPSKGGVLKDYSGDELVYSETMEDWRTHNGIDFAAEEGDQVVAAASGVVQKVYKDDMLGITVEIEHTNGVISRYSGLQSLDFISEGKKVNSGDIIGGVGTSGALEQESETHLHFEIIKNGEYENPNSYFAK